MRNIYKRCPKCGKDFWTHSEGRVLCPKCYAAKCAEQQEKEMQQCAEQTLTLRQTKEMVEARRKAYQVRRAIRHGGDKQSKAHKGGWTRHGC